MDLELNGWEWIGKTARGRERQVEKDPEKSDPAPRHRVRRTDYGQRRCGSPAAHLSHTVGLWSQDGLALANMIPLSPHIPHSTPFASPTNSSLRRAAFRHCRL